MSDGAADAGPREVKMSINRKQPNAGSARLDPEEMAIREQSLMLPATAEFGKLKNYISEVRQEQQDASETFMGHYDHFYNKVPPHKLSTIPRYKKELQRSTSALLLDLDLFGCKDIESNKRRIEHLDKAVNWFAVNRGHAPSTMKRQVSLPNFLTFNREEQPAAGSRRRYHLKLDNSFKEYLDTNPLNQK